MVCAPLSHAGCNYVSVGMLLDMWFQYRLPESGRRLSDIAQKGAVQSRDLLKLTLAILQARQSLTVSFTQ